MLNEYLAHFHQISVKQLVIKYTIKPEFLWENIHEFNTLVVGCFME